MSSFVNGFLALGIGTGGSFSEVSVSGYSRQAVVFTVATGVTITNGNALSFGNITSGAITQVAVYDAAVGGNLLFYWNISLGTPVSGEPFQIGGGKLKANVPSLLSGSTMVLSAGAALGTAHNLNPVFAGVQVTISIGIIVAGNTAPTAPTSSGPAPTAPLVTSAGVTLTSDQIAAGLINVGQGAPAATVTGPFYFDNAEGKLWALVGGAWAQMSFNVVQN